MRPEVEEESVEACAEADRAEDAEAHPPGAPDEVGLPVGQRLLVGALHASSNCHTPYQ